MKKKLLSSIMIFLTIAVWSQKKSKDDFSISINGNKIETTANVKTQIKELKKGTSKKNPRTDYFLLQFNEIPSLIEQQNLIKQGVTLLSYVSNNCYYAAVKSEFYDKSNISKNIRTLTLVEAKFKLDSNILQNSIPDYAIDGNGIKVVVSYFKGVDPKIISQDLGNLFVKNSKIDDFFNTIYLQAPKDKLEEIAELNWVQHIELVPAPVQSNNIPGSTSHKANILGSGIPGLGYGLTGKGVKIGVWDNNLEPHKDHTGRVTIKEYEDYGDHGLHVSGTIAGAGLLDPRARGMAPEVQMYGWNFNTQSNGLTVQAERVMSVRDDDIEMTSNSYGVHNIKGFNTLRYESSDRGDDDATVRYPYLLHIYANGNSQTTNPGGFNTCTHNSKNALHVANTKTDNSINSGSSFGPTIDGRLVPQIAGVGTDVYSLSYVNSYTSKTGTSMSTPGVTGTLALLYERYKNSYGKRPLASLMKALVTNTANDAGNLGPDYKYGFGNINGLRAIKVLDKGMFYTGSVANGATYEKDIVVPAGLVSLKVMLAYSDISATPGAVSVQVNDLDIKIVRDGKTTLPWVLNPTTPDVNAIRGVDNMNNIEQVTLDNPVAGTYKIIVTGTMVPLNSQEFSVVYDYVAPELILTYPVGGEKFNTESTEYIRWDYEGEVKTFTLEYSIDGGVNYIIIAKDIPSTARNFEWKVPAAIVANAKIRISAGTKTDTSKENFIIITEPRNFVIAPVTCGATSYKMDWDAIAGAKYEVLKMNGYAFDVVATVTNPTYTFADVTVGDDNWFSVRTVDVATGIVSERVPAVNVEPISQPVLSAINLPFLEDFNTRKATNFVLSKGKAGNMNYYNLKIRDVFSDVVKMEGSHNASLSAWVSSTTANAFSNNPDYIKKITFCDIDATNLVGKKLRMKFNLQWNSIDKSNKNFFRVLVNGVAISSHENIAVYGGTVLGGDADLVYDLSAYAGTSFSIALESVIDNNFVEINNNYFFNSLFIDNVTIFEATATDLALNSITATTGLTAAETVTLKIYNYSPVPVSNIPVSYKINGATPVVETIPGPINPLTEVSYSFSQKADFSIPEKYTVLASTDYPTDAIANNNSITTIVYNTGSDVLIGSGSTITTCSAVFTDSGNRFLNYKNNLDETMTFKPGTVGTRIKIDFSTFDVEEGYDFLFVFDGPTDSSALLGIFTGTTLPQSLISTAAGGELTFRFISNTGVSRAGWIAAISCVTKIVNDANVVSIVTPEVIGKKSSLHDITIKVSNLGPVALTNHPVFYQINGATKVTDVVPSIAPYTTASFTFVTKADLSSVNATYTIRSGVDIGDDNNANDIIEKIVFNNNDLPVHTNTNGYAISKLKWNEVINTSEATAYSDFKNIKIPIYAGTTYQPEVTLIKPEAPLDKYKTSSVGVFTMIVIDLNGDGNLTDEFYDGKFWINTLKSSELPIIPSSTSTHYFRDNTTLAEGITIPRGTTAGEKLMRVVHMLRKDQEYYNVNLGPTKDELTSSSSDFEVEEYTINVLPFTAADASIDKITVPVKPGNAPVSVRAVIRNYSTVAISNFPVAYRVNGGVEVIQNQVAAIPTGGTADIVFTTKADLGAPGDYTIDVYTKLAGDTDVTNDSKSIALSHVANYATNVVGTFDGVDDFIKIDSTPTLNLTNNYTFEAWINKKEGFRYYRSFFEKGSVIVYINNDSTSGVEDNSLILYIVTSAGNYILNTGLNSIKQNTWQHIAYSVSAANVYTIYIDGISVPFTTLTSVGARAARSNANFPAYIGNDASLIRGFKGNVDEVRIWSGVRDQATILANTMTKYTGNESGLLAYYSFSEGDKQFVFDSTSSDNTAVVTNADTNGQGEGKFWNVPVLLQKLDFVNQHLSSYDAATKTYTIKLNDGTDITKVVANYSLGMQSIAKINGTIQVSGVTTNDYTNPVTLTVEGVGFNSGISETYTIKVFVDFNEAKLLSYDFKTASNPGLAQEINTAIVGSNATKTLAYGTDVSNLIADFTVSPGAELYIDGVKQQNSKVVVSDYTNSFLVSVISRDKFLQTNYAVILDAKNSETDIVAYSVAGQVGATVIDPVSKTVKVMVNNNANLSALVPVFRTSDFATLRIGTYFQNSGVTSLNYALPVQYNVTAQNGTITNWTVSVEKAKPVISLLGDTVISLNSGCSYVEAGFTAKDNLDADIASAVVVTGIVDVNTAGQYILTYTVKDALQNESSVTRTINVSSTICKTLGIATNKIDGLVIYPNPVKEGKLYIQTASGSIKNISIADMSGKKVFVRQTENKELDVSGLPGGVYVIKIEQDGNTSVQKIIIK
ncbi:S8 family serine peptidase [Flavobacterium lipolyticum]|uniref:S8 family serine peptidase n=1 Tax=Flavobacterium lipolyticum TaxID=2893754 RepID=A0ABS8M5Q2_9FLAO|nr:S8 family serine peptidase [Flavobacterium sp. F-126]MCC9019553.1 S8 family serine peptidase [Flavobacterium sp. F-126]